MTPAVERTKQIPAFKMLQEFLEIDGARFVVATYRNEHGELSRYTLLCGAKVRNAYEKDMVTLLAYQPKNDIEKEAKEAILTSLSDSLTNGIGNNKKYTQKDTYTSIGTRGILKIHNETGEVYVNAFRIKKEVIEEGTYTVVNSKPLTIAKRKIEANLRKGKFRMFKMNLEKVKELAINGKRFIVVSA